MRGYVVDEAFAHDPNPPPIAQRLPVFGPCPHGLLRANPVPTGVTRRHAQIHTPGRSWPGGAAAGSESPCGGRAQLPLGSAIRFDKAPSNCAALKGLAMRG